MHQFTIVGETPQSRFGSRVPSSTLNGTALYRYQYVPLMGTLFFPQHLLAFRSWVAQYDDEAVAFNPAACVPTLVSNRWFQADPLAHWSAWLTRFAFESGWYALYTNFHSQGEVRPRALLVDESGAAVQQQRVEKIRRTRDTEEATPPSAAVPLFDFHFNRVQDSWRLVLRKDAFPPLRNASATGSAADPPAVSLLLRAIETRLTSRGRQDGVPAHSNAEDAELVELAKAVRSMDYIPAPPAAAAARNRCFTLDDHVARGVDVSSAPREDITASLPFPFNASFTLRELYNLTYHHVMAVLPATAGAPFTSRAARFLLYRPTGLAVPFDRHLRGLYFAFLAALVSERVLLIDLPDLDAQYDCPFPGVKWSWSALSRFFTAHSNYSTAEINATRLGLELRTRSLNAIYPQQLLVHSEAVSHDRVMFLNVAYKPYALALFDTASRMKRVGQIMRLLLSKPKNALVQQARALQQQLQLPKSRYSVAVHLVAGGDALRKSGDEDPLPLYAEHWACVQSLLLHLGLARDDVRLVLTSDSASERSVGRAAQLLEGYGAVVANGAIFLNDSSWGIGNSSVRASHILDSLTHALQIDQYLVNLFLLGDCDVSISSGTTYGIFGAARSGFSKRAFIFRAAPRPVKGKDGRIVVSDEQDYCGPMHRIDLPEENDIIF